MPALCIPIYEFEKNVRGFKLNLGFSVCVKLNANNIQATLPKPVEYYRGVALSVKRSGSISTSGGAQDTPLRYNIDQYKSSTLDPEDVFDFLQDVKFYVEPEIDLGVQVTCEVGDHVEANILVGAVLDSQWEFTANLEKCPCPYLYGNTSWDLSAYVSTPGLTVSEWELIPNYNLKVPIFKGLTTPTQCIFSPEKSVEGISSFKSAKSENSYIIRPIRFYRTGTRLPETFTSSLQALESGSIYQSLQFPKYSWSFDTGIIGNEEQKLLYKKMILVNPPESTVLRWKTNSYRLFWYNTYTSEEIDWRTEGEQEHVTGCGNAVVSKNKAVNVEIFKEFAFSSAASQKFISFSPAAPIGSVLGVIIHSTDGGDKYSAEPLEEVWDDSQSDDSITKEWVAPNQLNIQIESFTNKLVNASITFERKVSDSEKTTIGVGEVSDMKQGTSYKGADLGVPEGVVLDLSSGQPSLVVNVTVRNSETQKEEVMKTIDYNTLVTGSELDFQVSGTNFELKIHCIRSLPKVVFQLRHEMKPTHRGIVTRVFEETGSSLIDFAIQDIEKYGILRFKKAVSIVSNVFSVVYMPGLVPLCTHEALDDNTFMIPLVVDETLIDDTINIPFRIKDVNTNKYQATLRDVFGSTTDGLCGDGIQLDQAVGRIGCLESLVDDSTNKGWTILTDSGVLQSDSHSKTLEDGTGKWRLHVADVPAQSTVKIVPSVVTFPAKVSSFYIDRTVLEAFVGETAPKLRIDCQHCDTLRLTSSGNAVKELERGNDGLFSFIPDGVGDAVVVAVCESSKAAFCEFTETFVDEGLTLLKYQTAEGVKELDHSELAGKLLEGISRQVITNRTSAKLIKSWEGSIEKVRITKPDMLTFVVDKKTRGISKISAELGDVAIPLSAEKYYEDPDTFFTSLGVVKPAGGFTGDIVKFQGDGSVWVSNDAFSSATLESGAANVTYFLDVPESYVTGQQYKVIKGLSGGAIAGIVIAVLVVCAGIAVGSVFLVKYLKAKKRSKEMDDLAV